MRNTLLDMRSILSKTFLLSLLLGVAGASIQAGELYPWQLTRDSLLLFEGSTYRYTVDTPENEGLSSTLPFGRLSSFYFCRTGENRRFSGSWRLSAINF